MMSNDEESQASHWTQRLFVDNAHLYLPFLEAARHRADAEVGVMVDRFELEIPPNARVLDAGCGIGRHSVPLASRGYEVTGFDLSPLYLEEARLAAEGAGVTLRLIQGDTRELGRLLRDEAPFQAVVNMFTSHGYYREDADLRFFRDLHSLTVPGAALVIETLNRDYILRNFQPLGIVEAGGIEQHDHRRLNLETSCLENVWTFYEKSDDRLRLRLRLEFELRMYSLHELRELLGRAGWEPVSSFTREGDGTDTSPVKPDSFRMWIAARRVEGGGLAALFEGDVDKSLRRQKDLILYGACVKTINSGFTDLGYLNVPPDGRSAFVENFGRKIMGIVNWLKKKADESKQAQEKARVEHEQKQQEKREAEERERQLQLQRLEAERQCKENILAILNDDKLPDASWASREFLPFKFQKSEHLIYVFNDVEYLEGV